MPETQTAEPTMAEYVAARTANEDPVKAAAITPEKEQITTAPESATGTSEEEEKKAKGGGWQRRIDKLTKRGTELEESLKEEREARQRLEAKLAGRDPAELTKKETSTEPGARPKPKPTDAKYKGETAFDDYIEDLAEWKAEQATIKLKSELTTEQKQAQEKAQAEQTTKLIEDSWRGKAGKAEEKHPDWREIVFDEDGEASKLVAGSIIDGFILDPENDGPAVLYHLCKNPGEIERISALSPQKQIRELGKIEETLTAGKEEITSSPEPKKARLPEPIKPVSTSTSKSAVKPENMSMEEYARWRKANR